MPHSSPSYVLITRPEPEAQDYAAELQSHGFETLEEPMLKLEVLPFSAPELSDYEGLLFTSANGVEFFTKQVSSRNAPAFCVGKHTARAAEDAGFSDVYNASGTGVDLVNMIAQRYSGPPGKPFLHIRGRHAARALDEDLRGHGLPCEQLVIYDSTKVGRLSDDCIDAITAGRIHAVTFFSVRTAESFMELASANGLDGYLGRIKALCISESVLKYVQSKSWAGAYSAATPDRAGMLCLLKAHAASDT